MSDNPRQLVPRIARLLLISALAMGLIVSTTAVGAAHEGPHEDADDYEVEFSGGETAWVVFDDVLARPPTTLTAHVYDPDDGEVSDFTVTAREDDLEKLEGRYGDDDVYTATVADLCNDKNAVLVGVTLDKRTWENPYPSARGVDWLTPAEREALAEEPPTTAEQLDIEPVAVDFEDDLAKFRVTNDNDEDVTVQWKAFADRPAGKLTVPANGAATFVVPVDGATETVNLYYDGSRVDTATSNSVHADLEPSSVDDDDDKQCGCSN